MRGDVPTTTEEEHQDRRPTGSGLYVDMENLQAEGQTLIEGLINDWPVNVPPPCRPNLYVRADNAELWRLWASSRFKDMEVRAHGTQHFSSSSTKNSADMAIVAHAMADLALGRVTHVAIVSNDSDFISLYTAIRDDPGIPHPEGRVPFLWVVPGRNSPLSANVKRFFPPEAMHLAATEGVPNEDHPEPVASPGAKREPGDLLGENSGDIVGDNTTRAVQEHRLPANNQRALASTLHRQDRGRGLRERVQEQHLAHTETARGQNREPRKEARAVRDAGQAQRKLDTTEGA